MDAPTPTLRLPRRTLAAAILWAGCCAGWGLWRGPLGARIAGPGPAPAGPARTAAAGAVPLGEGFAVWESARDGEWRIWIREFSPGAERPLTRREPGVRHCCAHIAPDGTRVAYLAVRDGRYGEREVGELRLLDRANGQERVIAPDAQTYGAGHRAAIWHDARRLQWIDAAGRSVRIDLGSGAREVLAEPAESGFGWLVDPTERHATTGTPTFSPYSASRRAVSPRSALGGCEPYFSGDGSSAVWVAGAGGPIYRMDLDTRAVTRLLEKNDPRIDPGAPRPHAYVYFPMVSRAGDAIAFGASPGEHDHQRGDYDVFVAETDPATLELVGPIHRVTSAPGPDRYPDVHLAPLALGRWSGEVPFTLDLSPAALAAGPATDWSAPRGVEPLGGGRFRFPVAGTWEIGARRRSRDGERPAPLAVARVVARPGAPPRLVELARTGETSVALHFDEPVRLLPSARVTLESGGPADIVQAATPSRLELRLASARTGTDRLRLEGVVDRSEAARPFPADWVVLPAPAWPSRREGLLLAFQRGDRPNLVPAPEGERAVPLLGRRRAREDRHRRLLVGRGWFEATAADAAAIAEGLRTSNEFTVELLLAPDPATRAGVLLSLGRPRGGPNLEIEQRGSRLLARLLTGREAREVDLGVDLGASAAGGRHLAVSYAPGELRAHLDGRPSLRSAALQRDFFQWRAGTLTLGSGAGGASPWTGTLDHVAIHDRVLPEEEVSENARLALAARPPDDDVAQWVSARLEARSRVPSLEEIAPYRQALVVFEYRVEAAAAGARRFVAGSTLRVAHWAWLDGEAQAEAATAVGATVRLLLEPLALQPQLESVALFDDLPSGGPAIELDARP